MVFSVRHATIRARLQNLLQVPIVAGQRAVNAALERRTPTVTVAEWFPMGNGERTPLTGKEFQT
jgi:hypothetical protein